jgi:tetratricopeptide (TPR) repeat protein
MSTSISSNDEVAVTLFEMLVPNELKEYAPERRDMVLVLNEVAARYPWEMMQERRRAADAGQGEKPLAVQAGLVRQLMVEEFRDRVVMARGKRALVVGNPRSGFADLPGAAKEAQDVVGALKSAGYDPVSLIGDDAKGTAILTELFARDYEIVHLAGHGVFEHRPEVPCESCKQPTQGNPITGMVIDENQFLTAAQIGQMRSVPQLVFVNCCYLGNISDRHASLAANVATELIRIGVRGVVAAGWAVQDDAAALFAAVFYREMLSGSAFGNAVHEARIAVYSQFSEYNTWGAYQCYGDPDFTLAKGDAEQPRRHSFISYTAPSEAMVDLENVAAAAKTAKGPAIDEHLRKIKGIEQRVPSPWLASGALQAAMGQAYGEIKRFAEAVEHYRRAIEDEKGLATIKAAEQLWNLQSRWAQEMADTERERSVQLMAEAEKGLTDLNRALGETGERLSLLGSVAKRRMMISPEVSEKRAALYAMAEYYQRAYELGVERGKPDYYPFVNYLTGQTLAYLLEEKGELPAHFFDSVDEAMALAEDERRRRPDFWSTVTQVDCMLLRHLAAGDLPDHAADIIRGYGHAKNVGSPREFQSVLDQLDFLKQVIATAPKNELRRGLVAALETVRKVSESGDGSSEEGERSSRPGRPPTDETGDTGRLKRAIPPEGLSRGEPPPIVVPQMPGAVPQAPAKMSDTPPERAEELQPVQLGASAPGQAKPGGEFTARFAAYEKVLEQEVRDLLKKLSPSAEPTLGIEECRWKRGTFVTVKLSGRGLSLDPPEQQFVWQGGRSIVDFDVTVANDAEEGAIPLKFDVAIEGIVVARLRLELEITANPTKKAVSTAIGEPARTAFASYSSKDRLRVLDRVDAIQISAGIDVFQDCLDLNPGEEFKPRLDNEIRERDLFLLFWSKSASESKWVNWELETALKEKGEQALQLHPLDPGVKPPAGLEKLNIGSVAMWVRKGYEAVMAERKD